MVTLNPAKAVGMEKTLGSIEKGKKADLTIVDVKKPHLSPSYDIIAELTRFTYGSDVDTVIVNGKILMKNRKVLTMNEIEIVEKALKIGNIRYETVKDRISKMVAVNRWKIV
jgi:5-methylthioadenosine/S-adenosylhomocysteine deaminase